MQLIKNQKNVLLFIVSFMVLFSLTIQAETSNPPKSIPQDIPFKENSVSKDGRAFILNGPYSRENLTIYLIWCKDRISLKKYITLEDALEKKLVKISETGSVNTLTASNESKDYYLYIQAGEIVRGGKQDRTIGSDYIIEPMVKNIDLSSFCVEQGRWSKRSAESAEQFVSSHNYLATKELRLVSKNARSQGGVWQQVETIQDKLSDNIGGSVKSNVSGSSLELTLENDKVKDISQEYIKSLESIIENKADVIGFVFAINNQINSADIYINHDLFARLWPKLLKAAAVEALAELDKNKKFIPPSDKDFLSFLYEDEKGTKHENKINDNLKVVECEVEKRIIYETCYGDEKYPVHKNYIHLDENTKKLLRNLSQNRPPQTRSDVRLQQETIPVQQENNR